MLTSMCSMLFVASSVSITRVWTLCVKIIMSKIPWKSTSLFSLLRPRILEEEFQGISCRTWPQKIDTMGLGTPRDCIKSGTPRKINIEPENDGLEMIFLFQGCILRFHVSLPGCTRLQETKYLGSVDKSFKSQFSLSEMRLMMTKVTRGRIGSGLYHSP